MSRNKQDFATNERRQVRLTTTTTTTNQDNLDPVPRQLREAADLLQSISSGLEECSVEWQANVSRMQWKIFDSDSLLRESWKDTVLARKHFTEKVLDDAFQTLLSYNKAFADHLKNFIGLLQGVTPAATGEAESCQQDHSDDSLIDETVENSVLEPGRLSRMEVQCSMNPTNDKRSVDKFPSTIRNSFASLVKAKVDFDAKFLGFESVLHETSNASNFQPSCLCQICSDIVGTVLLSAGRRDGRFAATKKKAATVKRTKCKRLTRSARTLTAGRRGKSQPPPVERVGGDRSFVTSDKC